MTTEATTLSSNRPRTVYLSRWLLAAGLTMTGAWAFWPTLASLVQTWIAEPDYSHGFLVPVVALALLWLRRDTCPPVADSPAWSGIVVLTAAVALRGLGAAWYVESTDGWAFVLWIGGAVCLLTGWRVGLWAAPAIAFLLFMVPLPFRAEHALSEPLQRIATLGSAWMLQTLGQPAFAEGNLIVTREHVLEVERACAGLRIFVGIIAMAVAWALAMNRPLAQRAILVLAAIPVAIAANILRIVITAFAFAYGSEGFAAKLAHDGAGWLMMPLALGMMGCVYWYLTRLFVDVESLGVRDVVARRRGDRVQRLAKGQGSS